MKKTRKTIDWEIQKKSYEIIDVLKKELKTKSTIKELAKKSGLTEETLYRIFSYQGNPKISTLFSIAQILGVSFKLDLDFTPSKT